MKFCRCSCTGKKSCSTKGGTALNFRVSEILFPGFFIGNIKFFGELNKYVGKYIT